MHTHAWGRRPCSYLSTQFFVIGGVELSTRTVRIQEPMPRPPPVSNLHTLALHFYQQFHKYERPLQVDLGPQGNGINNLRQKSNINTMENTAMQGGPQKHTLESYDSDGGQAPCTGTTTWMVFKIPFHNSLWLLEESSSVTGTTRAGTCFICTFSINIVW